MHILFFICKLFFNQFRICDVSEEWSSAALLVEILTLLCCKWPFFARKHVDRNIPVLERTLPLIRDVEWKRQRQKISMFWSQAWHKSRGVDQHVTLSGMLDDQGVRQTGTFFLSDSLLRAASLVLVKRKRQKERGKLGFVCFLQPGVPAEPYTGLLILYQSDTSGSKAAGPLGLGPNALWPYKSPACTHLAPWPRLSCRPSPPTETSRLTALWHSIWVCRRVCFWVNTASAGFLSFSPQWVKPSLSKTWHAQKIHLCFRLAKGVAQPSEQSTFCVSTRQKKPLVSEGVYISTPSSGYLQCHRTDSFGPLAELRRSWTLFCGSNHET